MTIPQRCEGEAFNQVPESENRIHSDDVARSYGFRGGLVPGVTVSAYLIHPAIEAWGMDWLQRGRARVVVRKPLYDRERFRVEIAEASDSAYQATLVNSEGTHCATAEVEIPDREPAPPVVRAEVSLADGEERCLATRDDMEALRQRGLRSMPARWSAQAPMVSYLRDQSQMPELLRCEGPCYANSAFVLGLTNWILAANVRMTAWLHLQTESQNFEPIPRDSDLQVEAVVVELFQKKGHEFVDLDVVAYEPQTKQVFTSTRLRAIYKLRDAGV